MEFVSTHKWKILAVGAVLCALAFYLDRAEAGLAAFDQVNTFFAQ